MQQEKVPIVIIGAGPGRLALYHSFIKIKIKGIQCKNFLNKNLVLKVKLYTVNIFHLILSRD
jgi:hypothetical protein